MSTEAVADGHPRYVFDTSALLTLTGDEPGADEVAGLLIKARRGQLRAYVSFISAVEAGYKAYQVRGEEGLASVLAYLQQLPLIRVDVNDELIALAARMKGTYRLSLADAWVLATAKQLDATLIHKDPEFEQAGSEIKHHALPYR